MGELVDDVEPAVLAAIMRTILDEVVRPDVIRPLRPQAHARAVGKPKTAWFRLLLRDLEPLPFPDPLDPAVTDRPAGLAQQGSDLAITVAAVLPCQFNNVCRPPFSILSAPRYLALRRAVLPERRTSAALGHIAL